MPNPYRTSSGLFILRRRVPEALRTQLGWEYKESLKTHDAGEARTRYAEAWTRSEDAFAAARAQLEGREALSEADVQQLAARWVRDHQADMERTGDFDKWLFVGREGSWETPGGPSVDYAELMSVRRANEVGDEVDMTESAEHLAKDYLRKQRIPFPVAGSRTWHSLTHAFKKAFEELSDLAAKRRSGDWAASVSLMPHQALSMESGAAVSTSKEPQRQMKLLALFDLYAVTKRLDDGDGRSTKKTLATYRVVAERYVELCGDFPIERISRASVNEFRGKLAELPAKGEGIRGLSAPQLIAKAQAEGLPRISTATIRNNLRALSAVLSHGVGLGYLNENPVLASGVSKGAAKAATREAKANRRRKDYSREELRAIFSSAIYTPEGWSAPRADFGRAWYWVPLLLFYTGARREELAQLRVADVVQRGEGAYLSLLEAEDDSDGDRGVKTEGSRRRIPLHPGLVERGFFDYVATLPKEGQLFPQLKPNKSGYYGANFGKRWKHYLDTVVGLEASADPAHGFRHTFKTLCREAGIPEDVLDAITGHAGGNRVGRGYGSMPFGRLVEEIAKFPTVEALLASPSQQPPGS
jgi:integrase